MKTDEFQQAETLFFENQGRMSLTKIARRVGVSRRTMFKWAKDNQWQPRLSELNRKVSETITEKIDRIGEDLAAKASDIAARSLLPLDATLTLIADLIDQAGTNPLSPTQIRQLTSAQADIIKCSSLLGGQPTERQEISGKLSVDLEVNGFVDEAIQKIIKTGDPEGQVKLARLQEALQALIEDKG